MCASRRAWNSISRTAPSDRWRRARACWLCVTSPRSRQRMEPATEWRGVFPTTPPFGTGGSTINTQKRTTQPLLRAYPLSLDAVRAKIEVLFSTNLVEWQEGASQLEPISTKQLGDGRALVTWRVKSPLRDEPQVFMRLRVTAQ